MRRSGEARCALVGVCICAHTCVLRCASVNHAIMASHLQASQSVAFSWENHVEMILGTNGFRRKPKCCGFLLLSVAFSLSGFGGWMGLISRKVLHFSSNARMKQAALLSWRCCHIYSWIYQLKQKAPHSHLLNKYFHTERVCECVCICISDSASFTSSGGHTGAWSPFTSSMIGHYWCRYNVDS